MRGFTKTFVRTGSPIPVLLSPSHQSTGIYPPITFKWKGATGCNRYNFQLTESSDTNFENPVYNIYNICEVNYQIAQGGLISIEKEYIWRVRGYYIGVPADPYSATGLQYSIIKSNPPVITLSWTTVDKGLLGYRIFRKENVPEAEFELITEKEPIE